MFDLQQQVESHTGSHPPGFPGYSHTRFSLLTRKNIGMAVSATPSPLLLYFTFPVVYFFIRFSMCAFIGIVSEPRCRFRFIIADLCLLDS